MNYMKKMLIVFLSTVFVVTLSNAQSVLVQTKPSTIPDAKTSATTKQYKKIKSANLSEAKGKVKLSPNANLKGGKTNPTIH